MALEATHMRFALDLKDEYKVRDPEKYIVGTVYPDSRYITGINRELTHHEDFMRPEFAEDDFKKGWQVHQICDFIQNSIRKELFPECVSEDGEENFALFSAMKVVQDMNDLKFFDLQGCLQYLDYVYNPHGENMESLKEYNQIILDLYKNKKETTVEDNYKMWKALGISKERSDKIKEKVEEFLQDEDLTKRIQAIYDKMLRYHKEGRYSFD